MNRLRAMLVRDLSVFSALMAPMAAHDLFHFSDWLEWGLNFYGLEPLRAWFYPIFGHDMVGYVSHATILLAGWVAAAFIVFRLVHYVRLLERALERLQWYQP